MPTTALFYTAHARKDLLALDKPIARRIVLKIHENSALLDPLARAKALSGPLEGLYRYRVGEYRAIFEYEHGTTIHVLTILRVKHRKEVYE